MNPGYDEKNAKKIAENAALLQVPLTTFERDVFTSRVVASVLEAKNPLEAEKMLLAYEFENLDALVGLHMFDDYVLFGYAIKLKLLERLSSFEHEKGQAEFKSLFDGIQQQVYSL